MKMLAILVLLYLFCLESWAYNGKPKYVGETDAKFCNEQYGAHAKVAENVTTPLPCYIYCNVSGKVYLTARPPYSVCGHQRFCLKNQCIRKDGPLTTVCKNANKDYAYGTETGVETLTCVVHCYKENATSWHERVHKPDGSLCHATDKPDKTNGRLGICYGFTCWAINENEKRPLLKMIYNPIKGLIMDD